MNTHLPAPEPLVTDTDPVVLGAPRLRRLPTWLAIVHWAIIANFVIQCFYASWQVFVVLHPPDGSIGPAFGRALDMPHDLMVARRMYAQEGWLAFVGLAVYLGVTEIAPRRRT